MSPTTREKEAMKLAGILDGLHEGSYNLGTLYVDDPADGDCFVARAADLLREFSRSPTALPTSSQPSDGTFEFHGLIYCNACSQEINSEGAA